jgi:hypothetical protein
MHSTFAKKQRAILFFSLSRNFIRYQSHLIRWREMSFKLILATFVLISVVCVDGTLKLKCGKRLAASGNIWGGDHTSLNSWPWLVALHHSPKGTFFCAGSLITAKHVASGETKFNLETSCLNYSELLMIFLCRVILMFSKIPALIIFSLDLFSRSLF